MRFILISFLLLAFPLKSLAQDFHAWIYFNDKPNTIATIGAPINVVTQRSLDRKARHNIILDDRDLPINQSYVATVKSQPGIDYLTQSKWFNCAMVKGTPADIDNLLSLNFINRIEYADPTKSITDSDEVRDIEMVTTPLNYGNSSNQINMIGLAPLHNNGFTGSTMLIAVTDGGFPNVDTNPAFNYMRQQGNLLGGYDFVSGDAVIYDDGNHGSRVLSVMAARNTTSYEGAAPDAQYVLYRTEDGASETPAEMGYWVAAAERADSLGVDIINVSLGYLRFDNNAENLDYQDMDGITSFISRGTNIAYDKGMVIVTSAGNSGNSSNHPYNSSPADALGAFSIGAVTMTRARSSFSSIGPTVDGRIRPDVAARGSATAIIDENNNLVSASGTSFSAPIISGAIACLMQAFPNATPAQILDAVRDSGDQFSNPDNLLGYGIPDFSIAQQTLNGTDVLRDSALDYYINNDRLFVQYVSDKEITISLFNLSGQLLLENYTVTETGLNISQYSSGVYILESNLNDTAIKIILP